MVDLTTFTPKRFVSQFDSQLPKVTSSILPHFLLLSYYFTLFFGLFFYFVVTFDHSENFHEIMLKF